MIEEDHDADPGCGWPLFLILIAALVVWSLLLRACAG